MKRTYNSDSDDTHNFTAIISSPATDGIAVLSLTNTQTDVLKPGRYVYDAELSYNDSDENTIVERVLEGKILVTASVTR
jgi:GTPase Era involved in 16S rRNA processing